MVTPVELLTVKQSVDELSGLMKESSFRIGPIVIPYDVECSLKYHDESFIKCNLVFMDNLSIVVERESHIFIFPRSCCILKFKSDKEM